MDEDKEKVCMFCERHLSEDESDICIDCYYAMLDIAGQESSVNEHSVDVVQEEEE